MASRIKRQIQISQLINNCFYIDGIYKKIGKQFQEKEEKQQKREDLEKGDVDQSKQIQKYLDSNYDHREASDNRKKQEIVFEVDSDGDSGTYILLKIPNVSNSGEKIAIELNQFRKYGTSTKNNPQSNLLNIGVGDLSRMQGSSGVSRRISLQSNFKLSSVNSINLIEFCNSSAKDQMQINSEIVHQNPENQAQVADRSEEQFFSAQKLLDFIERLKIWKNW